MPLCKQFAYTIENSPLAGNPPAAPLPEADPAVQSGWPIPSLLALGLQPAFSPQTPS